MSDKKIFLEIVTPKKVVFKGNVDFVTAPSVVGSLGVLPEHTPLLAILKQGKVKVKQGETETIFTTTDGFLEILPDKVRILVEGCN